MQLRADLKKSSLTSDVSAPGLSKDDRHRFRLMAEHKDVEQGRAVSFRPLAMPRQPLDLDSFATMRRERDPLASANRPGDEPERATFQQIEGFAVVSRERNKAAAR